MLPVEIAEPMPSAVAQSRALAESAARALSWGLHATSHELRRWRRQAAAIQDPRLRADALASLGRKRTHAHGAALFTILPARREAALLRLLVAYETLVDCLDNMSERHPDPVDGRQLHRALIDALDPERRRSDYYVHHPWRDDGGYLAALVETCRAAARTLPSFERIQPLLERATRRSLVLGVNHDPDVRRRDAALRAWAVPELREQPQLAWFELSGAASATLAVHVLLALAAERRLPEGGPEAAHAAYWPWVCLATTMLDSWVDRTEDALAGHHSYVAHYPDEPTAVARVREAIERGLDDVRELPRGERHAVIVACMVAMYLSKHGARSRERREVARELLDAGGPLTCALLPVLRGWRLAYGQRSA